MLRPISRPSPVYPSLGPGFDPRRLLVPLGVAERGRSAGARGGSRARRRRRSPTLPASLAAPRPTRLASAARGRRAKRIGIARFAIVSGNVPIRASAFGRLCRVGGEAPVTALRPSVSSPPPSEPDVPVPEIRLSTNASGGRRWCECPVEAVEERRIVVAGAPIARALRVQRPLVPRRRDHRSPVAVAQDAHGGRPPLRRQGLSRLEASARQAWRELQGWRAALHRREHGRAWETLWLWDRGV